MLVPLGGIGSASRVNLLTAAGIISLAAIIFFAGGSELPRGTGRLAAPSSIGETPTRLKRLTAANEKRARSDLLPVLRAGPFLQLREKLGN